MRIEEWPAAGGRKKKLGMSSVAREDVLSIDETPDMRKRDASNDPGS